MSLTSQITSPTSPFMRFAAAELPNSAAVTAFINHPQSGHLSAAASHGGSRSDWRLIGTSIDFRLRLTFTHTPPVAESVRRGFRGLARSAQPGGFDILLTKLTGAITFILTDCPRAAGDDVALPEPIEFELIRLCVVAAQLDQLYRNPHLIETTPLLDDDRRIVSLGDAVAQVSPFVVDQIRAQVHLSAVGLAPLRSRFMRAVAGPTFAGSDLIGGADADLIADDLLLDFKSTREATIGRPEVYQLAGYLLLDFDDVHRIRRVGVYWTRHGVLRTLPADAFLELLGARKPVDRLRSAFRAQLEMERSSRRLAREPTLATSTDPAPEPGPAPPAATAPDGHGGFRAALRTVRNALHL